jgi:hypothetical protein
VISRQIFVGVERATLLRAQKFMILFMYKLLLGYISEFGAGPKNNKKMPIKPELTEPQKWTGKSKHLLVRRKKEQAKDQTENFLAQPCREIRKLMISDKKDQSRELDNQKYLKEQNSGVRSGKNAYWRTKGRESQNSRKRSKA